MTALETSRRLTEPLPGEPERDLSSHHTLLAGRRTQVGLSVSHKTCVTPTGSLDRLMRNLKVTASQREGDRLYVSDGLLHILHPSSQRLSGDLREETQERSPLLQSAPA